MQIGDLAKISTSSLASSSGLKWDSNTRHPGGSPMNKPPDHPQPPPPTTNTLALHSVFSCCFHHYRPLLVLYRTSIHVWFLTLSNQTVTLARWPQVTRDWADGPNTLAHKLLIPQQENSPREQIKEWMNCFTVWGTESWQIWQYFTTGLIYFFFFIKVQLGSTVTSTVGRTLHQNSGNKSHKYLKRSDWGERLKLCFWFEWTRHRKINTERSFC